MICNCWVGPNGEKCCKCGEETAPPQPPQAEGKSLAIKGLKDHEIQELVNLLTARLSPISKVQCLREMIHGEVVPYLESKGLRIDHLTGN